MTKIYEALQQASKDRAQPVETAPVAAVPPLPLAEIDESLLGACKRIDAQLDRSRGAVLAFVSVPAQPNGTPLLTLVARTAECCLKKRVLVVGGRVMGNGLHKNDPAWPEAPVNGNNGSRTDAVDAAIAAAGDPADVDRLCAQWRETFDWVLVDAALGGLPARTQLLCGAADGVVLVVEAERARWQAVKHQAEQIVANNGRILGAILSNQRQYIPEFLYQRL